MRADERAVNYYETSRSRQTAAVPAAAVPARSVAAAAAVAADELDDILNLYTSTATAAASAAATAAAAPVTSATLSRRYQPIRRTITDPINRVASVSAVPAIPFDAKDCPAATIGNGVEVKPSKLGRNAGLGLFVTRRFNAGALITEYDGCVIDEREAKARQEQKISTHIRSLGPKQAFIDGRHVPPNESWRGGASFANDSFGTPAYNAKWEQQRPGKYTVGVNRSGTNVFERVFLRALIDLVPGDEVYVDYGKGFWDLYPISK